MPAIAVTITPATVVTGATEMAETSYHSDVARAGEAIAPKAVAIAKSLFFILIHLPSFN